MVPFYIFWHCATFSERRKFFENFKSFSKKMFCAFWASDIAPTWDVPVLLVLSRLVVNCLASIFNYVHSDSLTGDVLAFVSSSSNSNDCLFQQMLLFVNYFRLLFVFVLGFDCFHFILDIFLNRFLVGGFINKRARLLQSLVFFLFLFKTDSKRRTLTFN